MHRTRRAVSATHQAPQGPHPSGQRRKILHASSRDFSRILCPDRPPGRLHRRHRRRPGVQPRRSPRGRCLDGDDPDRSCIDRLPCRRDHGLRRRCLASGTGWRDLRQPSGRSLGAHRRADDALHLGLPDVRCRGGVHRDGHGGRTPGGQRGRTDLGRARGDRDHPGCRGQRHTRGSTRCRRARDGNPD